MLKGKKCLSVNDDCREANDDCVECVVKNIFRNMWSRIDTLDDDGGEELGRST